MTVANTRNVRIRAITAGIELAHISDRGPFERAIERLARARERFVAEGYVVQTMRITIPPVLADLDSRAREEALRSIVEIDSLVTAAGVSWGTGPLLVADHDDEQLAPWTAELVRATKHTFFSICVASERGGVHARAARAAAQVTRAVANASADGKGSFHFAAAANIPAGTPFFPVGWHEGSESLAIGLESADLVASAVTGASDFEDARQRLASLMRIELTAIERAAAEIARGERVAYGGIDASPAPDGECSIGRALEALSGVPFGDAGTLRACALVTDVLKQLPIQRCGYSGLMLPVLEDAVLAQRAIEGRYGMRDLLLFSSVCGTGLDVVPVPGDTPVDTLANIILDVAAQSVKLRKPLSVRLFLVPGAKAGDPVHFDDPLLTDSVVFRAT